MPRLARVYATVGAVALAAFVGLSAWHAHGLLHSLSAEEHASFGRGLQQQALLGLGLLYLGNRLGQLRAGRWHAAAGLLFCFALLGFCLEVYLGALEKPRLGIAPQGGSAHILGWLLVAIGEARAPAQGR